MIKKLNKKMIISVIIGIASGGIIFADGVAGSGKSIWEVVAGIEERLNEVEAEATAINQSYITRWDKMIKACNSYVTYTGHKICKSQPDDECNKPEWQVICRDGYCKYKGFTTQVVNGKRYRVFNQRILARDFMKSISWAAGYED